MVRAGVLHPGVAEVKTPQDTAEWNALARDMGDADETITVDTQALERQARRALQEYNLQQAGVSYPQMGYVLPDGNIPANKLYEHLVIADALHTAEEEKLKEYGRH